MSARQPYNYRRAQARAEDDERAADAVVQRIRNALEMYPKPGPKRRYPAPSADRPESSKHAVFIASSTEELDEQRRDFMAAVGPAARGNKRRGRQALYAALVRHFQHLRRLGVTLPRNRSLSKRACAHGLGEILREHGCTTFTDAELLRNGGKRLELARKLETLFSRVADAVDGKLPPLNP